jgi:hypothetical protein
VCAIRPRRIAPFFRDCSPVERAFHRRQSGTVDFKRL